MERLEAAIGRFMAISVYLAAAILLLGAILLFVQKGTQLVNFATYHNEPIVLDSMVNIFYRALHFSALSIIEIGIIILVAAQIMRVALTTWLFLRLKDYWFVIFSAIILLLLLSSIIWKF